MDRYLAWLMTGGDQIFKPSSPKLVFWGFVIAVLIAVILAVIGYPMREIDTLQNIEPIATVLS